MDNYSRFDSQCSFCLWNEFNCSYCISRRLQSRTVVLCNIGVLFLLFVALCTDRCLFFLDCSAFVRFRDLSMIWEVLLSVIMYASPIIYPLAMMPENIQKIMLFNPLSFIIHFSKRGLIENYFTNFWNVLYLVLGVAEYSLFHY